MSIVTYSRLGVNGRFGNQLWQIAGTIAVAREHGYQPRFPAWEPAEWFTMPREWFQPEPGIESTTLADVPDCTRDYLQHYPLIAPHETALLNYFQHNPERDITELVDRYDPSTAAAVHVRRGDYAQEWRGHGMLTLDYYLNYWPEGRVLIFTDDPAWCADNLPGETVHIDPITDFMLMRQCSSFLISNSSFAWWAAWLADKPTTYPTPWFTGLQTGDMHVPGWTAVQR